MLADDLAYLGIAEAGRRFRRGVLSPVDLTRALLARIEQLEPAYHAFILVTPESAQAQAAKAATELASGLDRGPMHGIPYALKDIADVSGLPTTCHSKILAGNIATRDAALVTRLKDAGAVMLGKTALHEFASGGPANDLPWPAARNPWNPDLHPGGSSSGSGTALAAGLVPAAIGTDTAGSIRNPATCCGLVGMKPTFGLVDAAGVFPLAQSLDHAGPMTRTVEDNALMLAALCGEPTNLFVEGLRDGVKGLRIGVVEHFYMEDASADPRMVAAIGEAARVLRGLGAGVALIRLPALSAWNECGRIVQQFEQYAVHEKWLRERPQDYGLLGRSKLGAGAKVTVAEYEAASRQRVVLRDQLKASLHGVDAVMTLSGLELPCRLDDPERLAATYARHARMPFSLAGVPALAVPTGFTEDGLPLGMQLAAGAGREAMLYRIAWAYEDSTRWVERHAVP